MENKKYNILVNFEGNDSITSDPITIVKGDYNSVDFEFQFNKSYNLALFFLIKPNGKEFVTAISENKLTIDDVGIFDVVGKYQFGVSIYDENSKLTIASKGKIIVVDDLSIDSEEVKNDSNYKVLDDLVKRVESLLPTYNENATAQLKEFNDLVDIKIKEYNEKTNELLSNGLNGSPLVASSIEEMVDITRVYVNTTDGHWYYYNEIEWVDGGVYQATELSANSVTEEKTSFYEININKFIVENKNSRGYVINYDYNTGITTIAGTVSGTGGVEVSRFTILKKTIFKYVRVPLTNVQSYVRIYNINDLTTPVYSLPGNVINGDYEFEIGTYAIYIQANMNTVLDEKSRYFLIPKDIYESQNIIDKNSLYYPKYYNSHINEVNQDLYPFKNLLIAQLIGHDSSFVGTLDLVNNKLTIKPKTRFIYSFNRGNKQITHYTNMSVINTNFEDTIDLIDSNYPSDLYFICIDYLGVIHSIAGSSFTSVNDNYFIVGILIANEGKIVSYNLFNNKFNVVGGVEEEKDLSNLTLCCIGDSLTKPGENGSNALNPTYPETVKNILGLNSVTNCGLSGSTVANNTLSSSTPMSDDTRMATYPNADIIIVGGGYNDWGNNIPLGKFGNNDETTFIGGYQKLMKYLIENNPTSMIVCMITPMANSVPTTPNENGNTKLDFINAIRDVARYYSVPLLDMHQLGQLGFYNKSTWTNDGLHFKQEYVNNIYAPKIAKFIKDNIYV